MRCSCLLVLACLTASISSVHADVVEDVHRLSETSVLLSGTDAKAMLAQEWLKFDPDVLERREQALGRVRELGRRLAEDQDAGRGRECSTQVLLETKWRAIYTADFTKIEQRIRDLETSLGKDDQSYASQQSSADGSWGACYDSTTLKLEATTLGLQELEQRKTPPDHPIDLFPDLRSGKEAVAMISGFLVSDVARDGIDHRAELTALSDGATQFAFKPHWQPYLEDQVEGLLRDRDSGGIAQIRSDVRQFLNAWQDPSTGYWGAWYRVGGRIFRTSDLSMTFHLVSYLRGDVQRWPQIIETTFKIANDPYPYGWKYQSSFNNHNNYDVVKIFRYGWPHMTEDQRARARDAMRSMLRWALDRSLQPNGSFAPDHSFFSSVPSDYYFGISFFDEIGYWRADKRFWTDETFENGHANCLLIHARMDGLHLKGPIALAALQKLDDNCGTP